MVQIVSNVAKNIKGVVFDEAIIAVMSASLLSLSQESTMS
jgi:hypothetical protein